MPHGDDKKKSAQRVRGARAVLRDAGRAELPSRINKVISGNPRKLRAGAIMPVGFGGSARELKGRVRIRKNKGTPKKSHKNKVKNLEKNLRNFNQNAARNISERNKFRHEDNKQINRK